MLDLVLIVLGFVFLIAMMVFVINPPDAWIKRVFVRKRSKSGDE